MKPTEVFDREIEWSDLDRFVRSRKPGVTVGVVSGRRRAGKSFLLRRHVADGIYHQAIEEGRTPALDRVAALVAGRVGLPAGSVRFTDWLEALEALLRPPMPRVVVLDELPYLLRNSPELPSTIQRLYDDRRSGPPVRLLLCGSSLSVMNSLLVGSRPLRGRATLDLRVGTFDFRMARSYWGISDHETALSIDAVLGGAAGYRDLIEDSPPSRLDQLGPWLGATVMNPSHALYREDEYLLREDPRITDRALYQSILAAVAAGERSPTRIGARLGKDRTAMSHLLNVLIEAGFLRKDTDIANSRSVSYSVADPVLRFARLVIAPNRVRLDERQWAPVWTDAQATWRSQILGPHFEDVTRLWLQKYASQATTGGSVMQIGRLTVSDRDARAAIELDAVALGDRGRVLVIGEAKASTQPRDVDDLSRLERARAVLGDDAREAKLLLAATGGFTRRLRDTARRRSDVELADLARLYEGD